MTKDGPVASSKPCRAAHGTGGQTDDPAEQGEWRELATELLEVGAQMSRMRPEHKVSDAARGMPVVMRTLFEAKGPMSPGELARSVGVSDARIANTLRALEERGLVERRASEHDRRRVEVSLTELGREEARERGEEFLDIVGSFLQEMGEEDARDLLRIFGRIRDVMISRRAEGRQVHDPRAM